MSGFIFVVFSPIQTIHIVDANDTNAVCRRQHISLESLWRESQVIKGPKELLLVVCRPWVKGEVRDVVEGGTGGEQGLGGGGRRRRREL